MSEDGFLARWSRRKRETAKTHAVPTEPTPAIDPKRVEQPAGNLGREAPEDVETPALPLPSLDDLTPESDLVAFFRKDVPEALRNQALRRMWSLDPAIRDHVGFGEYAWDWHNPDSMPGFGPLTVAAEEMEKLVAQATGTGSSAPRRPEAGETRQVSASEGARPDVADDGVRDAEATGSAAVPDGDAVPPAESDSVATVAPLEPASAEPVRAASELRPRRRRHGGATPV